MEILKNHSNGSATNVAEQKSNPTEASEISLPEDMVFSQIITRLPIKTLARSKCVSKKWCSDISAGLLRDKLPFLMSMIFIATNANTDVACGGRQQFACAIDGQLLEDFPLDFFPSHEAASICGGSCGLLLCRILGSQDFYVVCPVTRKWAAIPCPDHEAYVSVLAYDPCSSTQYHVINFTGWWERGATAEVFSSKTWVWTKLYLDLDIPPCILSGYMHYNEGFVYLVAYRPANCIVRIDVTDDYTRCHIELPDPTEEHWVSRVSHSGGKLHYVHILQKHLKLWVLDESHTAYKWRLKHIVKIDDLVEGGWRPGVEVEILAMDPKKDILYIWSAWKIVQYDLTKREMTSKTWKFPKEASNRVVRTWMVPSWSYLPECMPDYLGRTGA